MDEVKERFHARFTMMDKRRQQMLFSRGGTYLTHDQLMVFEDYLHISVRRQSNAFPLMHLQLHLLQDLIRVQSVLSDLKGRKDKLQAYLVDHPDEKTTIDTEIADHDRGINVHEAIRRCIRDIGDGIAWRLFEYDRSVLTELAHRPSGKTVNIEGLESELAEFLNVFHSREGVAILTDLTHFLKLGDLIIKKDDGTFEIVEVKKGHKSSGRITRQRQEMRRTVEFLNTGEKEHAGVRFVIQDADITPQTVHSSIKVLLARSEKNGAAFEKIGDYLILYSCDAHTLGQIGFDKAQELFEDARRYTEKLLDQGDVLLPFFPDDRYISVQNSAPISIFPFPEFARIKLITGATYLSTFVNVSAVLRYFEQRGWIVVATPEECFRLAEEQNPRVEPIIAKLRKGRRTVQLSYHLIARIGYEFWKPRTLVDMCEVSFDSAMEQRAWRFTNLIGEAEIWD
jgi:hypothetical protein